MAEHRCHRRPKASSRDVKKKFFLGGVGFFFVKKRKENFGPRKKEKERKERTQSGERADGHVVTNRIYNT